MFFVQNEILENKLITLKTNTERQSFILWLSKFLEFLCRLKYIPECTVLELNVKILLNWQKVMKKKKELCWTITLPFSPFRPFFLPLAFPTREATSSSNLLHLFKKNCLILAMNLSNHFLELSQKSYESIPQTIWT